MVYSDTTNKDGIIQVAEVLCDFEDGYISGNSTLLRKFTIFANQILREVWSIIFNVYNGWQYDDGNNTDLPSSKTDLTSGTAKYILPTTALTVNRIDCYNSSGDSIRLDQITTEEIEEQGLDEFMSTPGVPKYYRLIGNTIELFPSPNYTTTSNTGLRVFFDRDVVEFATTDTTQSPGFASPFHYIVPLGMAMKWLKIKLPTSPSLANYREEYEIYKNDLKNFYSDRNKDGQPVRVRAKTYSFE